MTPENREGNITGFATAVGNISHELLAVGIEPQRLAAALRVEAGKVEARGPSPCRDSTDAEQIALLRKGHEFINTLQVAGIDERVIVSALTNVCIERVARTAGANGAAGWLARMSAHVVANADEINTTAQHH